MPCVIETGNVQRRSYLQANFTDAIFTDVSRRCQQAGVDQDKLEAELFCHIFSTIGNLQGVRCPKISEPRKDSHLLGFPSHKGLQALHRASQDLAHLQELCGLH